MITDRLLELAKAARPIDDDDYGSDRQVDAEFAFFEACREQAPTLFAEGSNFSKWSLNATPEEAIDEAVRLLTA